VGRTNDGLTGFCLNIRHFQSLKSGRPLTGHFTVRVVREGVLRDSNVAVIPEVDCTECLESAAPIRLGSVNVGGEITGGLVSVRGIYL
jgi:hypothetical protein